MKFTKLGDFCYISCSELRECVFVFNTITLQVEKVIDCEYWPLFDFLFDGTFELLKFCIELFFVRLFSLKFQNGCHNFRCHF